MKLKNRALILLAPFAMLPGLAMADATAAFTGAITDATTDIGVFGTALVGVAAVGVAFMIGLKYVKKIRGAA